MSQNAVFHFISIIARVLVGGYLNMNEVYRGNFINLSYRLSSIIGDARWEKDIIGCSSSEIFFLEGISNGENAYLKVNNCKDNLLEKEKEILIWLENKIPVPQVFYYDVFNGKEFLLISEIRGLNAAHDYYVSKPAKVVTTLAKSLRLIHEVNLYDCPFDSTLNKKIDEAKERINCGLVDENSFERKYIGKSSEQLFEMVLEKRPANEDLVFTHGDYCMPNIILSGNKLSGFIDLGRAGISDRYQDIALIVRSFEHNFGTDKWNDLFYKEYGITDVDYSKIEFYILLDELF